jgi:hypothetical protein
VIKHTADRRPRSAPEHLGRRTLPTTGWANALMSRLGPPTVASSAGAPRLSTCLAVIKRVFVFSEDVLLRHGKEPESV